MLSALRKSFPSVITHTNRVVRCKSKQDKCARNALIILAPGAEEMEFTISADVLRRAKIDVTVAGLHGCEPVKCSRSVVIVPDTSLELAVTRGDYDVLVLPGGLAGNKALMNSSAVGEVLRCQDSKGGLIAAICAAPTALAKHGIGRGKSITSHPDMQPQLMELYCYIDDKTVVQDGNLITSRGPGTTFDFALKITEQLVGVEVAKEVAKAMLWPYKP
ncbi:protein DJ-1alpha isoform X1 [Drosophila teissieri]|uniref:protein DJ-1alpha isoform X1 n=2 Tax=Drosophila teissieri TaxID=7243 RepID=UPI001CBA4814|nr:protein DJ-1alpha isoform X1 [Drosophila teissieri]